MFYLHFNVESWAIEELKLLIKYIAQKVLLEYG